VCPVASWVRKVGQEAGRFNLLTTANIWKSRLSMFLISILLVNSQNGSFFSPNVGISGRKFSDEEIF